MTMTSSPACGTSVRPWISTGIDGPASLIGLPFSSSMARTRPYEEPARITSPRFSVPDCTRIVATGPLPLSRRPSTTRPRAGASIGAFSSSTSACSSTCSSSASIPAPVLADTGTNGDSPPYSSGTTCSATSSCVTRSTLPPGLSILLIATTSGTHARKGFVTRRIEEGNGTARRFDVVSADVLRDPARFAGRHFGATNIVQQRGLTMVDVTHDGDHRCTRLRFEVSMLTLVGQQRFRIVLFGGVGFVAHLLDQDHRGFLIQHLVDGAHLAQFHQLLDDFGSLDGHLVRQLGHGDGFRHVDVFDDGFGRRLEIGFAIIRVRTATAATGLAATAPAVTAAAVAAATFVGRAAAWGAAFFRVIRPGRRDIGRFDRLLVGGDRFFIVFFLARLFIGRFVQRAFRRLRFDGDDWRDRLGSLDRAARRIHHGLDLGDFIGHGLAGAVGGFGLFSGFLGGGGSFFLRFLGGGFFLFLGGAVGGRLGTGGHCGGSGGGLGGGFLGFGFGFLLRFGFGLRGGLGLRILLGVELGQVLLLLAQVGFLTGDQFSLLAGFLFAAGRFGRIDDRCGRRGGDRRRGVVALHEGAHFLDGDLDRARLARSVGLLDLGGFLARQRDFFLFGVRRCAVGAAQVIQKLILIIFRQWI